MNTIKKEFYKQTDDKILNINSEEIFILADRNNLEFYVERLNKFRSNLNIYLFSQLSNIS